MNLFNNLPHKAISSDFTHERFLSMEAMTPDELKNGCENLRIIYSFKDSPFGKLLIASTHKGICYMVFVDESEPLEELQKLYPNALITQGNEPLHALGSELLMKTQETSVAIKLHVKGTVFQFKIWEQLLKIPEGRLSTYNTVALQTGNAKASRAAGAAIGANPIAFLIPCHRVVHTGGKVGKYRWGHSRKIALIQWESEGQNNY